MNCEKYKKLIEKYLDGIISDSELVDLKSHTESCLACKEEFERLKTLQAVIAESFSGKIIVEDAAEAVLSKLVNKKIELSTKVPFARWMSVAASFLIMVSLLSGFYLGRFSNVQTGQPLTAKTPLRITSLQGIVLVKHQEAALWEKLEPQSNVYVGDTFHSAAKAVFVMEFEDKSTVKLNQNSMLVLKKYNGETQFYLENGELAADLNSPHPPFVVSTPNGRVEALGTEFTVSVE
jgi:ferric-dicitrate binding protein FerR (iron transport regulator)